MTPLAALWLPILLSAVFVFVASSVIHMALPIHKGDFKKLPDEDKLGAAVRAAGVEPGSYMFPCAGSMQEMSSPEMIAKLELGPVGTMIVRRPGGFGLGRSLLLWFVFSLIVGAVSGYLAGIGHGPGAGGMTVFRVTGAAAMLGYCTSSLNEWMWKGLGTAVMVKFVVDGVIYGLVTAATFAWLWPTA
ncbi:MAG: hypothetical protein KDC98_16790 [Planctomycetes bacterium]|nr:hypothetical protein [Planctomycetota bacterium]